MSKEKLILGQLAEGKSQRLTASSLGVSRNTVVAVCSAAKRTGRSIPELLMLEEPEFLRVLFPEKAEEPVLEVPAAERPTLPVRLR